MYPTIDNPFMFILQNYVTPFSIPGLKNSKQLGTSKRGKPYLRKKDTLEQFLKQSRQKLAEAYENAGFVVVEQPRRVTGWGFIKIYMRNPELLPNNDIDNQYQTIQEILMPAVINDDAQLEGFYPQRLYTKSRYGQAAFFWFWAMEKDNFLFDQQIKFYQKHYEWIWSYIQLNTGSQDLALPNSIKTAVDNLMIYPDES